MLFITIPCEDKQIKFCNLPYRPFSAGSNLMPALIAPGMKFGLPPLRATFNAIQKCRILKIDRDIIYALLVIFILPILLITNQYKFSASLRVFVSYAIFTILEIIAFIARFNNNFKKIFKNLYLLGEKS